MANVSYGLLMGPVRNAIAKMGAKEVEFKDPIKTSLALWDNQKVLESQEERLKSAEELIHKKHVKNLADVRAGKEIEVEVVDPVTKEVSKKMQRVKPEVDDHEAYQKELNDLYKVEVEIEWAAINDEDLIAAKLTAFEIGALKELH